MSKHLKELILDIDATLVNSFPVSIEVYNNWISNPESKKYENRIINLQIIDIRDNQPKGVGDISCFLVVLRPHLKEFLEFCFEHFDKISIWSAGNFRYVMGVTARIFGNELFQRINKIYTRNDCNFLNEKGDLLHKDLGSKGFDLSQCLHLDDNGSTFGKNITNGVHIPAYNPPSITEEYIFFEDTCLLNFMQWIKSVNLNSCPDVRNLNKSNIFTSFHQKQV